MVYLVDFENVSSAGISGIQRLTKEDKVYIFYTANAANMSFAAHLNLLSSPAEIIYYNVASGGKNALDFQLSSFLGYLISKGEENAFCIISNDRGYEYVRTFWERSGLAADVSINSSPSINRALLPLERPFTAKIRQENADQAQLQAEEQPETEAPSQEEIPQETSSAPVVDAEEIIEKNPKKRGRPKGRKSEAKPAQNGEAESKNPDPAMETLKALIEKSYAEGNDKADEVMELLKRSSGKQQFYRELLKIFGMEKGVVVYKTIRPEYTNLTKLVRQ